MTLKEAWDTVYDLASENLIDPRDAEDNDMPNERNRQEQALQDIDALIRSHYSYDHPEEGG